jgi:hypothetical protein
MTRQWNLHFGIFANTTESGQWYHFKGGALLYNCSSPVAALVLYHNHSRIIGPTMEHAIPIGVEPISPLPPITSSSHRQQMLLLVFLTFQSSYSMVVIGYGDSLLEGLFQDKNQDQRICTIKAWHYIMTNPGLSSTMGLLLNFWISSGNGTVSNSINPMLHFLYLIGSAVWDVGSTKTVDPAFVSPSNCDRCIQMSRCTGNPLLPSKTQHQHSTWLTPGSETSTRNRRASWLS